MLKGHLPRVIYHQAYEYTKIKYSDRAEVLRDCLGTRWRNTRKPIFPHQPQGGLRKFLQTSTGLLEINFRALSGPNLVTLPPEFGVPRTLAYHRTVECFCVHRI